MESDNIEYITQRDIEQDISQDEYSRSLTPEQIDQFKQVEIADVINKLIKSDYYNVLEDDQKIFTQEMKTGNLDKNDYAFCLSVFRFISMVRSANSRYKIADPKVSTVIKSLLIEMYGRISLSNSKSGHFIELMLKNINEKTVSYQDRSKGFSNMLRGRRNR